MGIKSITVHENGSTPLAAMVEQRRALTDDKTRFTNRLGDTLKQYYPQALEWFDHRDTILFCDFVTRWPTQMHARKARKSVPEAFFKAHNLRSAGLIATRIEAIKASKPLTQDAAVITSHRLLALVLVEQIRITLQAIDRFDEEIAALAPTLPDYVLFSNLTGAGQALAPRLLAAFGEQLERYATADELQMYSGIAPVLERSGQKSWVHWRLRCPKFVRQTFVEWAAQPLINHFGQALFTSSSGEKAALIKLPCAHWHSSGFGSFSVAGKIARLMMNRST